MKQKGQGISCGILLCIHGRKEKVYVPRAKMAADENKHVRTHLYKYAHLHNDSEWVFFDVSLQVNGRVTQARNERPA